MPLHFQNGKAVEKLVPASTKTVRVMGPPAVPEAAVQAVLLHLASIGVFAREPAPLDSSTSELWHALARLGDGAWLAGHPGYDKDAVGNAQRWLERYARGLAVPAPGDPLPVGD